MVYPLLLWPVAAAVVTVEAEVTVVAEAEVTVVAEEAVTVEAVAVMAVMERAMVAVQVNGSKASNKTHTKIATGSKARSKARHVVVLFRAPSAEREMAPGREAGQRMAPGQTTPRISSNSRSLHY